MSVFFENHSRDHGYDSDFPQSRRTRREREDPPLWGFSYDRAEGVIHLLLAFSIVGGAAAALSSVVLAPEAPQARRVEARAAPQSPAHPPQQHNDTQRKADAPPATKPSSEAPALADARPPAPTSEPAPKPAASASLLDSRPLAEVNTMPAKALEPLAPPPPALRERLDPSEDTTRKIAAAAPPPVVEAAPVRADEVTPREEPPAPPQSEPEAPRRAKSEDRGRMAHCYLKLSGRVQSSGSCLVRRTEDSVILDLPGKPLEIAHAHGRVWTATLGGRSLGKVYRSGACWGARGFYACENG